MHVVSLPRCLASSLSVPRVAQTVPLQVSQTGLHRQNHCLSAHTSATMCRTHRYGTAYPTRPQALRLSAQCKPCPWTTSPSTTSPSRSCTEVPTCAATCMPTESRSPTKGEASSVKGAATLQSAAVQLARPRNQLLVTKAIRPPTTWFKTLGPGPGPSRHQLHPRPRP